MSKPQGYSARPTLRIDLSAVKSNYQALQKLSGTAKVAACVKADAYGLGLMPVAKALYGAGCRIFFVATAGEGKALREAVGENTSIYVLNGPAPRDLTLLFGAYLKPVINSMAQAQMWAKATTGVKSAPFCAVHIDTGMNRLGFGPDEFAMFAKNKSLQQKIGVDLVMSHLACAPDAAHPLNGEQLTRFRKAAAQLPMTTMSLANTAGVYLGKPYHFQMVRPGIGLYGGQATTKPKQEAVTPVVTMLASVLQIRNVKAGQTLGYEAAYTAKRDMTVATIGAGYGDGIPVSSSGSDERKGGHAIFRKQRVQIVGRVSMDLTLLDVTPVADQIAVGHQVAFRGDQLSLDAEASGTINYELLTSLGGRFRRDYIR